MKLLFLFLFLIGCSNHDYFIKEIKGPYSEAVNSKLKSSKDSKYEIAVMYNLTEYKCYKNGPLIGDYGVQKGVYISEMLEVKSHDLIITLYVDGVEKSKVAPFYKIFQGQYAFGENITSESDIASFIANHIERNIDILIDDYNETLNKV